MIIDGRMIAKDLEENLRQGFSSLNLERQPSVSFLTFGDDPATRSFLKIKQKVAERVGVELRVHELPENTLRDVAEKILTSLAHSSDNDGVVVQLPLPGHYDRESFLGLIPKDKDLDCLSPLSMEAFDRGENVFYPPVALAVKEILERHSISISQNKFAVVGHGGLVGKPVASWLRLMGADIEVFDIGSDLMRLQEFDVIISGVGKPGLIEEKMVSEGVVLVDAGTSEAHGKLSGDVSAGAFEKAALATPVPGGVGPVTVVKLFENLLSSMIKNQ